MHIHLDTVGGISGNMFVGAMLECWPELADQLTEQIEKAGFARMVKLVNQEKNDGVLTGTFFDVEDLSLHDSKHAHRHYREIRETLNNSELADSVKAHALGIFLCLAEAEASVHGKDIESVTFHEVGAWDSIADIVSAAYLIDASTASTWSVSSLPMGNGQVKTAHGMLPLPAPAVTLLLKGFQFHDDGLEGERVTPTGAAILKYLQANKPKPSTKLQLHTSGFGFGSRTFEGISNVLRVMIFSEADAELPWLEDSVLELAFEVDDQSPEDLAAGMEKVRQIEGVLDITQQTVLGKKQRAVSSFRLLVEAEVEQQVLAACFNETTTLGIRKEIVNRAVLNRMELEVELEGKIYRVKIVQRPNGELTAKAESEDYCQVSLSANERLLLKQDIEAQAFELLTEQVGDNE
jgi:pyridinium-3,5-bisthiocarboxylic acid mononucleotide nickel chelatase